MKAKEDESLKDEEISARWDAAAGVWAETVRSGGDINREAVNNPAMFKMLGTVKGKRILDLGCGEGYNARLLASEGQKSSGSMPRRR
ncbi:MAG: hypothetical protein ACE5LD_05235 [Candidatus Bipolaricaulia bacterium]